MHVHFAAFGELSLNENESSLLVVGLTPGPGASDPVYAHTVAFGRTFSLKISTVITKFRARASANSYRHGIGAWPEPAYPPGEMIC